jgi:hypothetical protein
MITKHCDGPLSRLVAPRVDQHVPRRVTAAADRTQIGSAFFVFSKQARLAFFDLSIAQTRLRHCKRHRQFTLARWPFYHRDECREQLEVCWPDDWVDIRRLDQIELEGRLRLVEFQIGSEWMPADRADSNRKGAA